MSVLKNKQENDFCSFITIRAEADAAEKEFFK
jgi:hypothetical protein